MLRFANDLAENSTHLILLPRNQTDTTHCCCWSILEPVATGSNRVKKSFLDHSAKRYQGLRWMSTSFHQKNRLSWWPQYPTHDDSGIKSICRSWSRLRRFICDKTRTSGETSLCRLEMPYSLRKGPSTYVFLTIRHFRNEKSKVSRVNFLGLLLGEGKKFGP